MAISEPAMTMLDSSPKKRWAKDNQRGIEGVLRPTFTPDFTTIDEESIRADVRQSLKHGYFSIMATVPGLTLEESKRFLTIACDEAAGHVQVCAVVAELPHEEALELLVHAEQAGCTRAFIKAIDLPDQTEDSLYENYRQLLGATDLGAVLFAYAHPVHLKWHPTGIPLGVLRRVAALPTAVGAKLTQTLNPAAVMEAAEALADRLYIMSADMSITPLLAKTYPVQWMGQFNMESIQSPEHPYAVQFMDKINAGKLDEALAIFWKVQPAFKAFSDLQRDFLVRGSHPWSHLKYHQWCMGGNGGLYRVVDTAPGAVLDAQGRQKIRDVYAKVGLTVTDAPEDEFIVGKLNYAKGIRPNDLSDLPCYTR